MDIEKLKNEIALKHGYQDEILGNAWDFAMQLTHRTKRQIALYEEVVAALAEYSHDTPAALPLQNVSFSLPFMDLEQAEKEAMETDYACFAVGEDINTGDAGAFYLEGYNKARMLLGNES